MPSPSLPTRRASALVVAVFWRYRRLEFRVTCRAVAFCYGHTYFGQCACPRGPFADRPDLKYAGGKCAHRGVRADRRRRGSDRRPSDRERTAGRAGGRGRARDVRVDRRGPAGVGTGRAGVRGPSGDVAPPPPCRAAGPGWRICRSRSSTSGRTCAHRSPSRSWAWGFASPGGNIGVISRRFTWR